MVEYADGLGGIQGFGDALGAEDAANYIEEMAIELAGLARTARLPDLATALDRVTALAVAAQSREKDASDNAA
jgi:hypothetical protein